MTKATFKFAYTDRYDDRYTELFYEYKGFEYSVTKANNWSACSSDYLPGGYMSLVNQHNRNQQAIDKKINGRETMPTKEEIEASQKALDDALDMLYLEY